MKKQLVIGFAAFASVALFGAARGVASWRPHKIAYVGWPKAYTPIGSPARLSNDGRFLLLHLSGGEHETLVVRDTSRWQLQRLVLLSDHLMDDATPCDVSPDGRQLVTLDGVGTTPSFSPSSEVSSLGGGALRVLNLKRPPQNRGSHNSWDARFSGNGREVRAAVAGSLWRWNSTNGHLIRRRTIPSSASTGRATDTTLSPDTTKVASIGAAVKGTTLTLTLTLWDVRAKPHQIGVALKGYAPVFSPDSRKFVYNADNGHTLVCADASTGKTLWKRTNNHTKGSVTWSRDGSAVFLLETPQITAFSTQSGKILGSTRAVPSPVQLLPAPTRGEVWCLDISAQLWSQRVY